MSNQIPERLINFTVYGEGNRIIGVADAKLPSIEMMTETVSGAGIAGELESGTLGHFKPMTVSLKWRLRRYEKCGMSIAGCYYGICLACQASLYPFCNILSISLSLYNTLPPSWM